MEHIIVFHPLSRDPQPKGDQRSKEKSKILTNRPNAYAYAPLFARVDEIPYMLSMRETFNFYGLECLRSVGGLMVS